MCEGEKKNYLAFKSRQNCRSQTNVDGVFPLQHHADIQVALPEAKAIFGGSKQLQPSSCSPKGRVTALPQISAQLKRYGRDFHATCRKSWVVMVGLHLGKQDEGFQLTGKLSPNEGLQVQKDVLSYAHFQLIRCKIILKKNKRKKN